MDEFFMEEAYKEALKAFQENEVPIGCVIVKSGKIIARGHNQKEKYNCVTKHAEIIAIEKACRKEKSWHLNDCSIYITVEPCLMCIGAIMQSHICSIYYSLSNDKFGAISGRYNILDKKKYNIKQIILDNKIHILMNNFFLNKR